MTHQAIRGCGSKRSRRCELLAGLLAALMVLTLVLALMQIAHTTMVQPASPQPHLPRRYYGLPDTEKATSGDTQWPPYTGRGVRVGLIDSGLAAGYAARSRNNVSCISFVPGVACDEAGSAHGTHSASVLGGNLDISSGGALPQRHGGKAGVMCMCTEARRQPRVLHGSQSGSLKPLRYLCDRYLGMAPDVEVVMLRVFDRTGRATPHAMHRALAAAAKMQLDVLSLSYGVAMGADATMQVLVKTLVKSGVVVVAAAGNEGPALDTLLAPAALDGVIAVGTLRALPLCHAPLRSAVLSLTTSRTRQQLCPALSFCARGATWGRGHARDKHAWPNVVALGEEVLAVERLTADSQHRTNRRCCKGGVPQPSAAPTNVSKSIQSGLVLRPASGTSVATPIVAGVVALCIEALRRVKGPQCSIDTARLTRLLMQTALPIGEKDCMRCSAASRHTQRRIHSTTQSHSVYFSESSARPAHLALVSTYAKHADGCRTNDTHCGNALCGKQCDHGYPLHPIHSKVCDQCARAVSPQRALCSIEGMIVDNIE